MTYEPNLLVLERFEKWKSYNEDVLPFMSFRYPQSLNETKKDKRNFYENRRYEHQKLLNKLADLERRVKTEIYNQTIKLKHNLIKCYHPNFIFEDQTDNYNQRLIVFLERKIQKMTKNYLSNFINFLQLKSIYSTQMKSLFTNNIVPFECVVSIYPEFFKLEYDIKYAQKIDLLIKILEKTMLKLTVARRPIWINDFTAFLSEMIEEGKNIIDQELFYFSPLNSEVSLSRYLFNFKSREGKAIDSFIARSAASKFELFPERVIEFCLAVVPKPLSSTTLNQSIALLIFYRALMDRIYITQTGYFSKSPDFSKFWRIASSPLKNFTIPNNMLQNLDPEKPIREVFLADQIFTAAADALTISVFYTSPIDILFQMNRGMIVIHKAAIANILKREPTADDLKQLLGFDDLFSLLLGTILASDIPDITQTGRVMKIFTPRSCLSPMLEYANANLEAIILHFQKV